MTLKKASGSLLPSEVDMLTKLNADGYFKAIDQAKLSKKKFLEALLNIQEEERKRLGQELHDSVNASLTIAKYYLRLLTAGTDKEKFAKEQLALIISSTEQAVRTISHEMVISQETDTGLIKLVDNLVVRINELQIFTGKFEYSNPKELDKLPCSQKMVLYRIVQEQVNNIIKYSKATTVEIGISLSGKVVKLMIKDNGVGFDLSQHRSGIGLSNIANRVKHFNGRSQIQSAPGMGCTVTVCMPVLE